MISFVKNCFSLELFGLNFEFYGEEYLEELI